MCTEGCVIFYHYACWRAFERFFKTSHPDFSWKVVPWVFFVSTAVGCSHWQWQWQSLASHAVGLPRTLAGLAGSPDLLRYYVPCIMHLPDRGTCSYCNELCVQRRKACSGSAGKLLLNGCLRYAEQGRALLHRRLLWGGEAGTGAAKRGYWADCAQVSATQPVLQRCFHT